MDILLVHGYNVTSTKTYGVLPQRLKAAGHSIKNVYLSKYVTLDDDVTIADLVRGFQAALTDVYGNKLQKTEFACVTHSTGALVVRSWIYTFYASRMSALPISHLIMLAPPNHGSRLATLGKSRLSRLRNLVGVEPGLKVLDALELGSDFQYGLDSAYIDCELHKAAGFYPFVITGQWIDHKLWDAIVPATYERGSDGVVRAASANMNTMRISIDPWGKPSVTGMNGIPFLITPKTSHSDTRYGVMGSIPSKGDHPVFKAIEEALDVENRRDYNALAAEFDRRTAELQDVETYYDGSSLDRYCQLIFRIRDNSGNDLSDYALELMDSSGSGGHLPSGFFGDQHKNAVSSEFFTYYLNFDRMSEIKDGKLGFRVHCAPNTPLVAYPKTEHMAEFDRVLKPNQTTWIDVVLRRRLNKNLFRLTTDFSEQKIKGDAGPEWIE